MVHRRTFVSGLTTGAAMLAVSRLAADSALGGGVGAVMPTVGKITDSPLPKNPPSKRYRPPHKLGIGGVAIGNGFAPMDDALSNETLQASWDAGVRFIDTSPWYGLGLSERRIGHFLKNHPADSYVLSTKIGRILTASKQPPKTMWQEASPFSYHYDYSAEGTRRSIEDSLQRLGVSQIDIVFIHDLSPDNGDMGEKWPEYFEQAAKGAMPELTRMREEGLIKAWGFGVNKPEPALRAVEVADPDIFLLATQYSLIDHADAAANTLPRLAEKGVSVVVGAPLMAGYLAGRERYLYGGTIPPDAPAKRKQLADVAAKHGVDLRTASLQFAAAPDVVSAVIPGVRTPGQVIANVESMKVSIPSEFWSELKDLKLVSKDAAVPKPVG